MSKRLSKILSILFTVLAVIATIYTFVCFIVLVSPLSVFMEGGPPLWFFLPVMIAITTGLYWLGSHFRKIGKEKQNGQS